ncbi:hypothetical protein [Paenibacillus polymyxa]|uniref:Uncharacterized protein n=1 Tax=Paenibacillus polymyxa TaxID=1406 RepID=A0AAP4EBI3_PAEPO|nr:hypothetical protein [Paenibacillus polymyxa]MDH2332478.1 hypothetical protein [Paenibacillus polymyxa]
MAHLNGIIREVEPRVIEYKGVRFINVKDTAKVGDIVVCSSDDYWDIDKGDCFLIDSLYGGDASFTDNAGDVRIINEGGNSTDAAGVCGVYERDFNVYEPCEASTEALLAVQREELVKITANIAELEAKLADEKTLKVGDYARRLITGQVVRVVVDDRSELPLKTVPALGSDESDFYGWSTRSQLVKLTPAEAKAAILAQVEAQFREVA